MRFCFPIILLALLYGCKTKTNLPASQPHILAPKTPALQNLNYDSCKRQVQLIKEQNRTKWPKLTKTEKEKIVVSAITETIIPNWIGTKWDFNGTTEIPQKGGIACGYFVTTVLRDAGFKLSRARLAQCASEEMILALVQRKYVQRFSNISIENFIKAIQRNSTGLYIVGLDNHTGFIYSNGMDIYFIHSSFVGTRNVQMELAKDSWVLSRSHYKVLANLSGDEELLNKWAH